MSGKIYVYTDITCIMMSGFTVMICVSMAIVGGGGVIFWPRRLRDPWHSLFGLRFCFLGAANKFNVVGFAIATVGILEIRFCS